MCVCVCVCVCVWGGGGGGVDELSVCSRGIEIVSGSETSWQTKHADCSIFNLPCALNVSLRSVLELIRVS